MCILTIVRLVTHFEYPHTMIVNIFKEGNSMERFELVENMRRYIGKTVTIFTTSGGLSGSGFTGVLAWADERVVKLITGIGAPPACPIGSSCDGSFGPCGSGSWGGGSWGCGMGGSWGGSSRGSWWGSNSWLGSITEIPIHAVASFTHNAI